jgi:hypothetical protein
MRFMSIAVDVLLGIWKYTTIIWLDCDEWVKSCDVERMKFFGFCWARETTACVLRRESSEINNLLKSCRIYFID